MRFRRKSILVRIITFLFEIVTGFAKVRLFINFLKFWFRKLILRFKLSFLEIFDFWFLVDQVVLNLLLDWKEWRFYFIRKNWIKVFNIWLDISGKKTVQKFGPIKSLSAIERFLFSIKKVNAIWLIENPWIFGATLCLNILFKVF